MLCCGLFPEPNPEEIILALAQPSSTYTSWYHGQKKCNFFGLFLNSPIKVTLLKIENTIRGTIWIVI
jgi:hypothetical protein